MPKVVALHVGSGKGSPEFARECRELAKLYGCDAQAFAPGRYAQVEEMLYDHGSADADMAAIFCHGFRTRLQTGHATGWRALAPGFADVQRLADALATVLAVDGVVALYACSTAGSLHVEHDAEVMGDGGFADLLRDALGKRGLSGGWVDAHSVAGHTTRNPLVRRFYTDGDDKPSPGQGGEWLVVPRSPLWPRWRSALVGELRYRFPLMHTENIQSYLAKPAVP